MKAPVAGTSLRYDVRGEGPTVLLLHAFPLDLTMWDAPAKALAATHRVLRFDARGFGGTPPGEGLLTMERIADDAAALLDHLGLSRAVVCGLSMGGYAAFAFVRRHADRLAGLVLADTRTAPDSVEARRARSAQADAVRREGPAGIADGFLQKALGATTQKERPEVVARVREMVLAAPARGVVDALAGLAARGDSAPTLREIRVPTLVLCGAEDALTPPADAEAIHRGVPGSTLVVLPGAGHLSALEDPPAFTAALAGFLRTLPRQEAR
jgi:pimeloyl-ACP methyl ester carboxylesterase